MAFGASVREIRAIEIGVAAAHAIERDDILELPCACVACANHRESVERAMIDRGRPGATVTAYGVAIVALLDELRREADEQAAR